MGFVDPAFVAGATDSHTCAICMQLLENPVIACDEGHTFCYGCLDDALKRDDRCPTCRAEEIVFVKCRALENSIAEMKMRCEHSAPAAAPAEEPAPKRRCAKVRRCSTAPASCAMMAPANGLGCEWRGRVSEYRAHLDVCVFKPRACTYCGVLVSKRDEVSHAAVCVVTCPFYGCYHTCPRSQMAAHQVDAAGEHAMISARKICSLETTQAAFMRSVQLLKEQARMTPVDIDFSIDASTAFAVPETGETIIDSPPVMVRQGGAVMAPFRLILGFRWIVSAADARAAGDSPYGIYLLVLNQDAKPAVCRGKLCICDRRRDQPYKALTWGGRDRNHQLRYGSMSGLKLTLSAADKARITQEYGMIRFIGKFHVDMPAVSKWLEL